MSASDGTVLGTTKIVDHGPDKLRWNFVIVSEGYKSSEMGQFAIDAQQIANTLIATKPFDELQGVINVHRVDVASSQSGADDPTSCGGTGAVVATYFDASFCNEGLQRLLEVNDDAVISVVGHLVPQYHMILVLVNSLVNGGSGGVIAVASKAAGAIEIALHEMGHTAFGLADEYESYEGCGVDTDHNQHSSDEPSEPNVTISADRHSIKWKEFILPFTAVPTTANADCSQCDPQASPVPVGTVGAFEGADYYHCGAYRPEFNCRMRNLAQPFCAVCLQVIRNTLARFVIPGPVSGTPGIAPRSGLGMGTLELVAPLPSVGLAHYQRDNNAPGMPWNGPFVFGSNVGRFDAAAALSSGDSNLEVVAIFQGQLIRYWGTQSSPGFQWPNPTTLGNQPVSGNVVLKRAIYDLGALLTAEVLVPLAAGGIAHYWRDARSANVVWHGPTIFGTNVGHFDAVAMVQTNFGDPANGNMPTNLEVVARSGAQLFHYWRAPGAASPWNGPTPIGGPGVTGVPSFLKRDFSTGNDRNYELVVPLAAGGIAHYFSDAPGQPWTLGKVSGKDIGLFDSALLFLRPYTLATVPPNTLQAVVRFQNKMLFYYWVPGTFTRWTLL